MTRPEAPASPPAGGRPPAPAEAGHRPSWVQRFQLATVCLGFLVLALTQQPGKVVADTKLDLAVDPWGFLGRALQLWEPEGFAGQVQNQAYGYLFPIGPFFALGDTVGVPVWVVQRLWMALLLCVAFLGVVVLARRLRIGTHESQLLAGLVYALAPRMVSGVGVTSIEVLPMALAPWVLVPLVAGARGGSPRRAAGLSALAVFCVGGVNAVATAAVLPLAAVYLLTRPPGPRRRRLVAWWVGCVALATAWWAGPLLLLGRYSPPFLDHIETAATTTQPTGLLSALRGTTQWVAYLSRPDGPLWPAGWDLVHDTLPIVATVLLVLAGLLGLVRSDLPDRTWLVLGLLGGLVLVTAGHLGPVQGLVAEPVNSLLDGVLAPLRNVHKFDPVLRIPLALGVAHLVGVLLRRSRRTGRDRWRPLARAGAALVVLALVAVASPAVAGRLSPPTAFTALPPYWEDTAEWLAGASPSGRALVLPASSFGTYAWGSTGDEPLQPLARSDWEVRNAIPLTPVAHIRMLDEVEERLARGEGSAGLTRYLARAGISHLVVRNDLEAGPAGATRPILVHRALRDSPGISPVASFGPRFPADDSFFGRALDAYLAVPRPAVEVYAVSDPAPDAYVTPLSEAVSVVGGPDAVLALEERGLLTDRPALVVDGDRTRAGTVMVSDAQVRRERTFGRTGAAESAGLTLDDPLRLDGPARDYLYPGAEAGESVVRLDGGRLSASSSASDADSYGETRPGDQPYAAVDGDPTTAWRPALRVVGEAQPVWWRLEADRPITGGSVLLQLADGFAEDDLPDRLRLTTDAGEVTVPLEATDRPQRLELPAGATRTLEIAAVGDAQGRTTADLAIAELEIPGITLTRTVVTPAPPGPASVYAFDAGHPAASGCVLDPSGAPRCAAQLVRPPEEPGGIDRVLTVAEAADYAVSVTARPRPGVWLDALIADVARPLGPQVTASSAAVPDPRAGAEALVDGDPETVWLAAADDRDPTVTLRWAVPQTIDRLRVVTDVDDAASLPTAVRLDAEGLDRTVELDDDGLAVFPALTTDELTLSFPLREELRSFDPYTRLAAVLGIGIAELELAAVPAASPTTVVDLPCGQGPEVVVDGVTRQTSVRTTLAGLRALEPVEATPCSTGTTGRLTAGEHRFAATSTGTFSVESATLLRVDEAAPTAGRRSPVTISRWDAEHRSVRVADRSEATLLVVPENVNPGWSATLDGRPLESLVVDGWQQAYLLPAGPAGEVRLDFGPGSLYRGALLAGALGLVLLGVLVLWPARRPGPPPTGRRRSAGVVALGVVVAATALIGGVVGLGALLVAVGVGWAAGTRRPLALSLLVSTALLAAGAVALVTGTVWQSPPGNAGVAAGQALALVAVSAVAAALVPVRRPDLSGTSPRQRRNGRSSSR